MPFEHNPFPTPKEVTSQQFFQTLELLIASLEKLLKKENLDKDNHDGINEALVLMNKAVMYATTIDRTYTPIESRLTRWARALAALGGITAQVVLEMDHYDYPVLLGNSNDLEASVDNTTGRVTNTVNILMIIDNLKQMLPQ